MENVLYADILFMINFSMDFITLYLTSRLTSGPPAGYRSALAATIGGVYATAVTAISFTGTLSVIALGAVSAAMIVVAFGFGGKAILLRRTAVFWGLSMLLGGAVSAVCSLGFGGIVDTSPEGGTVILFAGSAMAILFVKVIAQFKRRRAISVKITLDGKSTTFEALLDSGNLISDPLSGSSVIIADSTVLRSIVPELCKGCTEISDTLRTRVRLIPVKGFAGNGLLTGFRPDHVVLIDKGYEKSCSAVIAISDGGSTFFGGYPANVPTSLT